MYWHLNLSFEPKKKRKKEKKNIDIFYMKLEVNIEILLWYHLKSGLKLSTFVMCKWHCIREDDNHGDT